MSMTRQSSFEELDLLKKEYYQEISKDAIGKPEVSDVLNAIFSEQTPNLAYDFREIARKLNALSKDRFIHGEFFLAQMYYLRWRYKEHKRHYHLLTKIFSPVLARTRELKESYHQLYRTMVRVVSMCYYRRFFELAEFRFSTGDPFNREFLDDVIANAQVRIFFEEENRGFFWKVTNSKGVENYIIATTSYMLDFQTENPLLEEILNKCQYLICDEVDDPMALQVPSRDLFNKDKEIVMKHARENGWEFLYFSTQKEVDSLRQNFKVDYVEDRQSYVEPIGTFAHYNYSPKKLMWDSLSKLEIMKHGDEKSLEKYIESWKVSRIMKNHLVSERIEKWFSNKEGKFNLANYITETTIPTCIFVGMHYTAIPGGLVSRLQESPEFTIERLGAPLEKSQKETQGPNHLDLDTLILPAD